jgi:hypothetical protein
MRAIVLGKELLLVLLWTAEAACCMLQLFDEPICVIFVQKKMDNKQDKNDVHTCQKARS